MTNEEFAVKCGIRIVECRDGTIGYQYGDSPNVTYTGFKSAEAAYKGFIMNQFHCTSVGQAVMDLLKASRCKPKVRKAKVLPPLEQHARLDGELNHAVAIKIISSYGGVTATMLAERDFKVAALVYAKFKSGNSIPIDRVTIKQSELEEIFREYR